MTDIERTDRCWHCKGTTACAAWCHIRTFPTEADEEQSELASLAATAGRALRDERRHYEIACAENARLRAERDHARRIAVELENQLAAVLGECDAIVAEVYGRCGRTCLRCGRGCSSSTPSRCASSARCSRSICRPRRWRPDTGRR